MAGLSIKCPKCREKMTIRSSQSITETITQAFLYCAGCGIKAKALAHLQDMEIAEYKPFDLVNGNHSQIKTENTK